MADLKTGIIGYIEMTSCPHVPGFLKATFNPPETIFTGVKDGRPAVETPCLSI